MSLADVGIIGMASMGANLARNFARHGHIVAVFNRTPGRAEEVVRQYGSEGDLRAASTIEDLVAGLERPRRVIVLVGAGAPTDTMIDELAVALEPGDVIVDGGNTYFEDTRRREAQLRTRGLHLLGAGISGGERGALTGPSIMAGGSAEAYASLGPLLEGISADAGGRPCCARQGPDGAGHFVKMVHNGIEYADMQLISESYDLLRQALGLAPAEIAELFRSWNDTELQSFLLEITAEVLAHTDETTGAAMVDVIVDRAEQQGVGRLTAMHALDLGVPATVMVESIVAHALARVPGQRASARSVLRGPNRRAGDGSLVQDVRLALYASKIVAYAQGFDHITAASDAYGWDIDRAGVAAIWRAGCIIRSPFLDRVRAAYEEQPGLCTLLVSPNFSDLVSQAQDAWRRGRHRRHDRRSHLRLERSAGLLRWTAPRAAPGRADPGTAGPLRRGCVPQDRPSRSVFHTDWPGNRREHGVGP